MVTTAQRQNRIAALLAATFEGTPTEVDSRVAIIQGKTNNLVGASLDLRLDSYIEGLVRLQREQDTTKRERLEDECANDLGIPLKKTRKDPKDDDDDDDPKPRKESVSRSILETPKEADKRTLSKRLVEVVGGHDNGHVISVPFRAFMDNPSLPPMFASRLTAMMNADLFAVQSFAMAKQKSVTKADFEKLGEMQFADCMAKAFVLAEAFQKSVTEQFVWEETTLDTQLEDVTRSAVALALRDARGESIKDGKTTDIFSAKIISAMLEKAVSSREPEKQSKIQKPEKPMWMAEAVKVKNPQIVCTTCQGLGHTSCKAGTFQGWCSRCHGYGHKSQACQSTKE